jgi:hypothetical protein
LGKVGCPGGFAVVPYLPIKRVRNGLAFLLRIILKKPVDMGELAYILSAPVRSVG